MYNTVTQYVRRAKAGGRRRGSATLSSAEKCSAGIIIYWDFYSIETWEDVTEKLTLSLVRLQAVLLLHVRLYTAATMPYARALAPQ